MTSNLKKLEHIYYALKFENVSKAATVGFISQPALTQMIKEFEDSHELALFDRVGKRMVITEQGKAIKDILEELMTAVTEFENQLSEISHKQSGKVLVGIPPVILTVFFYEIIFNFMTQYPNVDLQIVELGANELKKKFLKKELDLVVLIEPFENDRIRKKLLVENYFVAVINQEHPLSQRTQIELKDLVNEKLILLNEEFSLYELIMMSFEKEKIVPEIAFKSTQWDLLINMVAYNKESISILPSPIVEKSAQTNVVTLPIKLTTNWKIILCQHKDLAYSRASRQFVDYVVKWFDDF